MSFLHGRAAAQCSRSLSRGARRVTRSLTLTVTLTVTLWPSVGQSVAHGSAALQYRYSMVPVLEYLVPGYVPGYGTRAPAMHKTVQPFCACACAFPPPFPE